MPALQPTALSEEGDPVATETTNVLETEIQAYDKKLRELEKVYPGKFVVFKGEEFIGAWDTLNAAAAEAVARFGRGPYLIRQVGAPPPTLPASVLFRQLA
jgi:hypothetical protein